MTYETPKLNVVGKAEEVILGVVPTGDDLDCNICIPDFEYFEDDSSHS